MAQTGREQLTAYRANLAEMTADQLVSEFVKAVQFGRDWNEVRDELLRRLSAGNPQAEKVQIADAVTARDSAIVAMNEPLAYAETFANVTGSSSNDYFGNIQFPAQSGDPVIVSRSLDELIAYVHQQTVRAGKAIDTLGLSHRERWIYTTACGSARRVDDPPSVNVAIVAVGQACADKIAAGEKTCVWHEWTLYARANGHPDAPCSCMACSRSAVSS